MAALTTHVATLAGLRLDDKYVAASAGGDDCDTGPGVELNVKNGDAAAHTVTIATPGQIDGDLDIADRTVSVPAGAEFAIPVTHRYRDRATGRATITYDAVTSVQVAVTRAVVS